MESGERLVVPRGTTIPLLPCDHCEREYLLTQLHPVIVTGVQSYNGHLLTNKPEERHVPLCGDCYENFKKTSIAGMTVEDDQEGIDAIAAFEQAVQQAV